MVITRAKKLLGIGPVSSTVAAVARPPEVELLLACLQIRPDPARIIALAALPGLNWDYLLQMTRRHKVMPLFYQRLKSCDLPSTVPAQPLQKLENQFNSNIVRNLLLNAELARLFKLFKANGIPLQTFKGPSLAQLAYDSLALRQFADLDLLVPPAFAIAACRLLQAHSYRPEFELQPPQLKAHIRLNYELAHYSLQEGVTVDLHWAVLPRRFSFSPDPALVWSHSQAVNLGSPHAGPVTTLANEELLLFLCGHCAKDNWSKLVALCDIANLVQNQSLDWARLSSQAQAGFLISRPMFLTALRLAHTLLGANLPPLILQELADDPVSRSLAAQVEAVFFNERKNLWAWFVTQNFYRKSMQRWRDKLWYWIDALFLPSPVDMAALPLPAWLYPLYYPLRMWSFGLKYSRLIAATLRRPKT